jgi:hypothetical protein
MITITTASCISIIWFCDLQLHMSCITEIDVAIVVVIIWWCDLQLHMSYITEIQGAVVVVTLVFHYYMTYVVVNHTTI